MRECGKARLAIDAGDLFNDEALILTSLPYGALPRLILVYIFSHAVRYKDSTIYLGRSAAEFMRRLGLHPTGGKRGNYTALKNQLHCLLGINVECDFNVKNKAMSYCGKIFSGHPLVYAGEKSWSPTLTIRDDFYDLLVTQRNAVPIDTRAVSALKGSALALDIYFMLAERLHRASERPVTLYWKNLREQFASEYVDSGNGKRSFKENFLKALKKVKLVYPAADIEVSSGGVLIKKSPPPIPQKL